MAQSDQNKASDTSSAGIAYQGEPGANSHIACRAAYPELAPLPHATFEGTLAAVQNGDAQLAMIPIENSVAGRVADIHHLLPDANLYVIGEHFERVRHQLLGLKGTELEGLEKVLSHTQALGQCRQAIRELNLRAIPEADTAGSARMVSEAGDTTMSAIASELAADIYGLEVLKNDIEDESHNTTRFLILSRDPDDAEPEDGDIMTTFIFKVRNVPAALYKAMGGFATNGVNMTKLESYQPDGAFMATMFYADIQGHPEEENVRLALEELSFFSSKLTILGTYKANRKNLDVGS